MSESDDAMRLMSDITAGRVSASRAIQTPLTLIEKVKKLVNDRARYMAEIKKLRAEKNPSSSDVLKMQVRDLEIRLQTMYGKYRDGIRKNAALQAQAQARASMTPGGMMRVKRRSSLTKSDESYGTPVHQAQRSRSSTSNVRAQSTATPSTRITGLNSSIRRGLSERPAERVTATELPSARTDDSEGHGFLEEAGVEEFDQCLSGMNGFSGINGLSGIHGNFHLHPASKMTPTGLAASPSAPNLQRSPMTKNLQVPSRFRSSSAGRREETMWEKCMRRVTNKTNATNSFDPPKRDSLGASLPPSGVQRCDSGVVGGGGDGIQIPVPCVSSALTGRQHSIPVHVISQPPSSRQGGGTHTTMITKQGLCAQNTHQCIGSNGSISTHHASAFPSTRHLGHTPTTTSISVPVRQLSPQLQPATRITKSMVTPWSTTRSTWGPG